MWFVQLLTTTAGFTFFITNFKSKICNEIIINEEKGLLEGI